MNKDNVKNLLSSDKTNENGSSKLEDKSSDFINPKDVKLKEVREVGVYRSKLPMLRKSESSLVPLAGLMVALFLLSVIDYGVNFYEVAKKDLFSNQLALASLSIKDEFTHKIKLGRENFSTSEIGEVKNKITEVYSEGGEIIGGVKTGVVIVKNDVDSSINIVNYNIKKLSQSLEGGLSGVESGADKVYLATRNILKPNNDRLATNQISNSLFSLEQIQLPDMGVKDFMGSSFSNLNQFDKRLAMSAISVTNMLALTTGGILDELQAMLWLKIYETEEFADMIYERGLIIAQNINNRWSEFLSFGGEDESLSEEEIKKEVERQVDLQMQELKEALLSGQAVVARQPSRDRQGLVVIPSDGEKNLEVTRENIENMFSDPVDIEFRDDGTTGIITPRFRSRENESYIFLLTPLKN